MSMSDVISLGSGALGLFKGATEVVKNIRDLKPGTDAEQKKLIDSALETLRDQMSELKDKHLALQQIAIAALQENTVMLEEKRRLVEKLAKLDKFEAERDLFERIPLALNTSAYREKTFSGPADQQPLFCPECFDNSKKSYLSFHEHAMHTQHMKCSACGTSVHVPRNDGPSVMSVRVKTRKDFFGDY